MGAAWSKAVRLLRAHAWEVALGLCCALFAVVKVVAFWHSKPAATGDENVWNHIARFSIWSTDFWYAHRPFVVPLMYKLCGGDIHRAAWLQCGLASIAWSALAVVLARLCARKSVGLAACFTTLLLALSSPLHGWDFVRRSESPSTSFLVLTIAAGLWLVHAAATREDRVAARRPAVPLALACVSGGLAVFARDNLSYATPVLALGLATVPVAFMFADRTPPPAPLPRAARWRESWSRLNRSARACAVLAAALVVLSWASQHNMRQALRYQGPLMNVIFQRVLPDPDALAYFRDQLAMPVSPALLERNKKWHSSDDKLAFKSPLLADFRAWIANRGDRAYQHYLLAHAPWALRKAAGAFPGFMKSRLTDYAKSGKNRVSSFADLLFVRGPSARYPRLASAMLMCLAGLGLRSRERGARILAGLALILAVTSFVQAFLAYHGDAMEVARHGLIVGNLMRLALAVGVFLLLELAPGWVHAMRARRLRVRAVPS